jgi:hypothetical protein
VLPDAALSIKAEDGNRFQDGTILKIKAIRLLRQIRLPGLSRAGKSVEERDRVGLGLRNPRRKAVSKSGLARAAMLA